MNFTFGIITGGGADSRIQQIVKSIEEENIPDYEIIVVGSCSVSSPHLKVVSFDESVKQKWITKKKNIITEQASCENIVYMHDYISLCPGWYEGFLKFGDDFRACMTRMINMDGSRYRDWTLWAEDNPSAGHDLLLPYTEKGLSRIMYFSGAYWVAKKSLMQEYPLNESLTWGFGEDVEWSKRVRERYPFAMNAESTVTLLIYHHPIFRDASEEYLKTARNRLGIMSAPGDGER